MISKIKDYQHVQNVYHLENEMVSFFSLFKDVYELLVSHKIHSDNYNYPASDKIFTL